jgi:hypothetical protein
MIKMKLPILLSDIINFKIFNGKFNKNNDSTQIKPKQIEEKFFNKEKINKNKIKIIFKKFNKSKIIPKQKLYNGGKNEFNKYNINRKFFKLDFGRFNRYRNNKPIL